jgi:arylmalonate decarboxylase
MTLPTIGMIVPPAAGELPPEARVLYRDEVRFAARGLGLRALTLEGYAEAVERVARLARELREDEGAEAVSLMGTSLSFFRGGAYNDELVEVMERASGVPATTMSHSIRDALRAVGARRVAVGTAYTDQVNARLRTFLSGAGFEVASMEGLGLEAIGDIHAVTEDQVTALALRAFEAAGERADAIFVSCGGLPALHLAPAVEPQTGVPVVASATAGVWGAVRLLGMSGAAAPLGALGRAPSPGPARAAG